MNTVKTNIIQNKINPFQQDIFGIGIPINQELVLDYAKRFDFEENPGEQEEIKIYKKIALLIKNEEKASIVIEETNKKLEITEGKINYVAALIRNDETLQVYLFSTNSELSLEENKSLIIENYDNYEYIVSSMKEKNNKHFQKIDFSWSLSSENDWNDKNYVLTQLEENFKINIKKIANHLWKDNDVQMMIFKQSLKHNMLSELPEEFYLNTQITPKITQDSQLFIHMWWEVYHKIYEKDQINKELQQEACFDNNDDDIENFNRKKHTRKTNQIFTLPVLQQELIKYLTNHCFNNIEWVKGIIKEGELGTIFPYLSKELKDEELLNYWLIDHEKVGAELNVILSNHFFDKKENTIHFLNNINISQYINKNAVVDKITQNKEELKEIIEALDNGFILKDNLTALWESKEVKKEMLKSSSLIYSFIKKDINYYSYLSGEEQKNSGLAEQYLLNGGNYANINKEYWNELKKDLPDNVITAMIKKNPAIMLDDNIPVAWSRKKQNMLLLDSSIYKLQIKEKEWVELLGYNIEEYKELLIICPKIYNDIPLKVKKNKEICLLLLRFSTQSNIDLTYVNEWFASKTFCIEALKIDRESGFTNYYKKIPTAFYQDKEFLQLLLPLIDNKEIKKDFLKETPMINNFFEAHEVTENYSQFFMQHLLAYELNKQNQAVVVAKKKL